MTKSVLLKQIFNYYCRKKNEIDKESKLIEELLLAAKYGKWEKVWEILGSPSCPNKSHLLNVIPQSRRWCVLHQAVYWNNSDVIQKLLKFRTCDSEIKAKKCLSECGQTDRMTALQIAESYKYQAMSDILEKNRLNSVLEQKIPTFQDYTGFNENQSQSLLLLTLSSYKKAFHPKAVDPNRSVLDLLQDIYKDLQNNPHRWVEVRDVVADSVFTANSDKADAISGCDTMDKFFDRVVKSYTDEDNTIYRFLNMAFRRQKQTGYRPTGEDLAMGPYCLVCQMLLLFWHDLPPESGITHRKMKMCVTDLDQYKVGKKFVWLSVVSSALRVDHTHAFPTLGPTGDVTVMFQIDNSRKSFWQPRNIEKHAQYNETERTYPAGARFLVTSRIQKSSNEVHIYLQLLA